MRRWQAETIFWSLWANLFLMAWLAAHHPRYGTWCLLAGGASSVAAYAFLMLASWRGWVKRGNG